MTKTAADVANDALRLDLFRKAVKEIIPHMDAIQKAIKDAGFDGDIDFTLCDDGYRSMKVRGIGWQYMQYGGRHMVRFEHESELQPDAPEEA